MRSAKVERIVELDHLGIASDVIQGIGIIFILGLFSVHFSSILDWKGKAYSILIQY